MGLILLWLVFWTCGYVLGPRIQDELPPPSPWTLRTEIAVAVVALAELPWIAAGFRPY
jgi:hypothetical protein